MTSDYLHCQFLFIVTETKHNRVGGEGVSRGDSGGEKEKTPSSETW